ncbi:phosphate ABC transporter substrate-binding protein [Desulfospira joergensenii]|uniref:phosphate ABC transporter substrate-binding protein n=1 Tax=Desulfospira joergensenii TaxID=53329 RepID=UPI00244671C3|nr:phosphate ABC transporter substrate-binding protein [Desulfospira joergensenii]
MAFSFGFISCSQNNNDPIRINGSTTIEPFMKKAAALFREKNNTAILITARGSVSGIDSLISGSCDMVMSSSEILESQNLLAGQKGLNLKSFLLGYDIIVPIVHPDNPVSNLSLVQLKGIFNGKIKNWSALGGKNLPIDLINRNSTSGTFRVWDRIMADGARAKGREVGSSSSVLAHIAENENAIGYISHSFVNPEIKILQVDGIDIEHRENWINNHPIKRPLFLYVNENKFNDTIKEMIIFIIMNQEVEELFKKSGFFST